MKLLIKRNELFTNIFFLFINATMIVDLLRRLCLVLHINSDITDLIRNSIYLILFVFILYDAYKNNKINIFIITYIIYGIASIFTLVQNENIFSIWLSGSLLFVTRCVPGLYLGLTYGFRDEDIKIFKKYFILLMIYTLLVYYMKNILGFSDASGGYMTFGYNILFQVELMLFYSIRKPKLVRLTLLVLVIGIMFTLGARGPIICLVISTLIWIILSFKKLSLKIKTFLIISCGSILLMLTLLSNQILDFLVNNFSDSRMVMLLSSNTLFTSSNRDSIYIRLYENMRERYFFPAGIYGDRILLRGSDSEATGAYAHNLFLEILYQWGGIIGIILICALIYLFIRTFLILKRQELINVKLLYSVYLSGVALLFFSSSYLINEKFWLCIGAFFCILRVNKKTTSIQVINDS